MKNNKGLSVIAITIALMLLATFAFAVASLISVRSEIPADAVYSKRALYIAEAGLAVAKYTLRSNWSLWSDPNAFPSTSFAGGTFDADVAAGSDPDKEAFVTVTGSVGNSTRKILSKISRYNDALTSAVYTNGTYAAGGSSSVTGEVNVCDEPIPGLNMAAAIATARANTSNGYAARTDGNYFQGDFSPAPSSLNGVMFIDAFPDGTPANVEISGNIDTDDGNPAILIIMGDLRISGNVIFHGLIYITGEADIDTSLLGTMSLDGGLITSGDVNLSGNSNITYNSDMVITPTVLSLLIGGDTPQEKTWEEVSP